MANSNSIPGHIKKHLEDVIVSFGLESNEETMDRLIAGWIEKENVFKEKMLEMGMVETDVFEKNDDRGSLALTYSGSIIGIGPKVDGDRTVDYTSIGFRNDVPDMLIKNGCSLSENILLDKGILFKDGPIEQTSPIFKIVVCPETLSVDEQEDMIEKATTVIIDSFTDINERTIIS